MGAVRELERIIATMSARCEVQGQGVSNYMKRESHYLGEGVKKILLAAKPQSASFQKLDNYSLNAGGEKKKRKALTGNQRSDCEISDGDTITVVVQN